MSILRKSSLREPMADLFDSFASDDFLTLTAEIPRRFCADNAALVVTDDDTGATARMDMRAIGKTFAFDSFELCLDIASLAHEDGGLFYYHFELSGERGAFIVSQDADGEPTVVQCSAEEISRFQLLIYRADFYTPKLVKGGIIYQVFVDRFARSPEFPHVTREGEQQNADWEHGCPEFAPYPGAPLDNREFFGGTLDGVREKLDYIASLGANLIYLNPIFRARSNHKYDTGDYLEVDSGFGGDAAFERLLAAANERGIGVILDGVFNHTGDDSRYFNKYGGYDGVGAAQSRASPYADWYTFDEYPDKYRSWWGISILPSLNHGSPTLRDFLLGRDGVVRHYLRQGIVGWRLDVADELGGDFIQTLKTAARTENSAALIIGEVWEDASNKIAYSVRRRYLRGGELDAVMNYPLREAIIEFFLHGNAKKLYYTLKILYAHYPKCVSDCNMNFLGTHDTERILSALAGRDMSGMSNADLALDRLTEEEYAIAKRRLTEAYRLLCALPGIPTIYYGDEAGAEGGRDPFNRRPYPWGHEDADLSAEFKKIGEWRRENAELLAEGYYRGLSYDGGVFAFERFDLKGKRFEMVIQSVK